MLTDGSNVSQQSSVIESARRIGERIASWSFPIRLLIGVASILVGSGYLGLLSEFAAYSYAIHFGFRAPVEGLPYLRATVTLFSLVLLSGAFLTFLLAQGLISWARNWARKRRPSESASPEPLERFLKGLVFSGVSLLVTLPVLIVFWVRLPGSAVAALIGVAWSAFLLLLGMISFRWPKFRYVFGTVLTALVLLVAPFLMFHAHYYAAFLRHTGYGGGLPVQLTVSTTVAPAEDTQIVSGALMARTSSAVILYTSNGRFVEYPIESVLAIAHDKDATWSSSKILPHPARSGLRRW